MIRRASTADRRWIIGAAEVLFADLGPYAWILSQWMDHSGVRAWLDTEDAEPRAFAILAFYREASTPGGPQVPVADLLALGVVPAWQGRGLGRALLGHVVRAASRAARGQGIDTLRLTVAADNAAAQRMYASAGFVATDTPACAYPSGTAARQMVRPLP